jgi:hypothetical protein
LPLHSIAPQCGPECKFCENDEDYSYQSSKSDIEETDESPSSRSSEETDD